MREWVGQSFNLNNLMLFCHFKTLKKLKRTHLHQMAPCLVLCWVEAFLRFLINSERSDICFEICPITKNLSAFKEIKYFPLIFLSPCGQLEFSAWEVKSCNWGMKICRFGIKIKQFVGIWLCKSDSNYSNKLVPIFSGPAW